MEIVNATCREGFHGRQPRYEIAVEIAHGGPDGEARAIADRFDARLAECAAGYARERSSARLAPVKVHLVAPGSFLAEWKRRVREGNRPPQVKDRVFWRDDDSWRRLLG
jgi:hypothetical protein